MIGSELGYAGSELGYAGSEHVANSNVANSTSSETGVNPCSLWKPVFTPAKTLCFNYRLNNDTATQSSSPPPITLVFTLKNGLKNEKWLVFTTSGWRLMRN